MKKMIIFFIVCSMAIISFAQDVSLAWAKKMGGAGTDIGYSTAVDALGNVYTTGQNSGTVDFDPGIGTNFLTSGSFDIFVAKLTQESVDAPPTIISFSPSSAVVGTSITITGTNFNPIAANNIVYFGAVKATVTSGTTTSLTVTAPAGATYQPISVLDNTTGLTGYSSKPFITTFTNPFGTGIPANFYNPKVDISTGDQSACLAIGDVDGDGKPDLVVANWNSSTISVLRNISTSGNISAASFAAKVDFATRATPSTIAIGDVDGDGKPDIVVGYRYSENVSVLRNTSTSGSINASSLAARVDFVTGDVTVSVAIGDVDGDGKPEIMVANLNAITVSVFRNTSSPGSISMSSFAARVDFPVTSYPSYVAIGDVDGDGKPDLVVANYGAYSISVLRNTSTSGNIDASSFAAKVDFGTGPNPYSLAISDIDGDGKPDLSVVGVGTYTMYLFRNTSTPGSINASSFAAAVGLDLGNQSVHVAIGDVDGDGKPDVVSVHQYSHKLSVLRNVSTSGIINTSSFASRVEFVTGNLPSSVAIGDLNGDGKPEIAGSNMDINTVSVFQIGSSTSPPTITCPVNITVSNTTGQCGAFVNFAATETLGIPASVITYSQNPGTFFPIGTTTVTATATNEVGTSTCSFTVTVLDNQPPTIICSAPVTINTTPGLCTGTTTLTPPTVVDNCGSFGNALSFNQGYVDVPNSASINPYNGWTIETWAKRANTNTQEGLIEKYMPDASTYGYLLRFVGNNAMAGFVIGSYAGYFPIGTTNILPNTWYHLAATFNRTTGVLRLYVNGVLDAQQSGLTGLPVLPSSLSLKLGARGDDAATPLSNGSLMDEVRIWDVERSQAQIQATMNSELGVQPGLVALYHFNQGVAGGNNIGLSTAIDASGNSNNGTLINFALTGPISNWVGGMGSGPTLTNNAPAAFPIGNTTVTWTAIDASGNSSTCSQIVTVVDNQVPVISCPVNISVVATSAAGAAIIYTTPIGTDNCSSTTIRTAGLASGSTFPIGTTTVTHKVTDGAGLTAECSFTVTVTGLASQIICPPNITVNNTLGQCGAIVNFVATETTGIPASVITYSQNPGTFFPIGTTNVTATATNAIGTSICSFTVTVTDNEKPKITCNAPIVANNTPGVCGAAVSYTVISSDNCPGKVVTQTAGLASGSVFPIGVTMNSFLVTDASGNTATCSFTVTVNDNEAPVSSSAASFNIYSGFYNYNGTTNKSILDAQIASQTLLGHQSINCINSFQDPFYPSSLNHGYYITVPFTETTAANFSFRLGADFGGGGAVFLDGHYLIGKTGDLWWGYNWNSAGVLAAYNKPVSAGNHILEIYGWEYCCFGAMSIQVDLNSDGIWDCAGSLPTVTAQCSATVTAPTAMDNCAGVVTGTTNDPTTYTAQGNYTVHWTFNDGHGNSSTANQTVIVNDVTPPVITCPPNVNHTADAGICSYSFAPIAATATDNCGAVTVSGVRSDALSLGSPYPVGVTTITWTATDAHNLRVSCVQTVTVTDDERPVITCPANVNHTADAGVCSYRFTPIAATATDNCPGVTVLGIRSDAKPLSDPYPVGVTTITWTATDAHNLRVSCSQTVTVTDDENPVITCPANVNHTADAGLCSYRLNPTAATATDNCPGVAVLGIRSDAKPLNDPYPVGVTTITWTATDTHYHSVSCDQTVTITDDEKPVITLQDIFKCFADNNAGCNINLGATVTDNCGLLSLTSNAPVCFPVGTTTVIWTAIDTHGNSSTATQTVSRNPEININICAGPTLRIYTGTAASGTGPFGPQRVNLASTVTGGTPDYSYSWSPASGLNNANIANPVASPAVTTTYTLTVTDSKGCTRSLNITLEVLPLSTAICSGTGNNIKYAVCHIPPGLPSNPQNICISESALNAHLISGSVGHNNCYLGPCGQQLCFSTEQVAPAFVSATSSAGKGKAALAEQITIPEFSVKANPNPSTHSFNVKVESQDQFTQIQIKAINITGQVMESRNNITLGLPIIIGDNFRPGIYIIEVTQGKNHKQIKLVKQ